MHEAAVVTAAKSERLNDQGLLAMVFRNGQQGRISETNFSQRLHGRRGDKSLDPGKTVRRLLDAGYIARAESQFELKAAGGSGGKDRLVRVRCFTLTADGMRFMRQGSEDRSETFSAGTLR